VNAGRRKWRKATLRAARDVREAEARLRRKRMEYISDRDANSIHL
jgi:hypothetical protein